MQSAKIGDEKLAIATFKDSQLGPVVEKREETKADEIIDNIRVQEGSEADDSENVEKESEEENSSEADDSENEEEESEEENSSEADDSENEEEE